jgi:hypothetical protein
MENDPLCIKEDVCDMVVCDGVSSCSHAVLKTAVLAQQSTNKPMPKLPLMRFEVYAALGCAIVEGEGVATRQYRSIVDDVYDLLERQLRQ